MPEKTTKIMPQISVDEIKGSCPKCGGPLELREKVEAWNPDGTPSKEDTYTFPYCLACDLFWIGEPADEKKTIAGYGALSRLDEFSFEPVQVQPGDRWIAPNNTDEIVFYRNGKEYARRKLKG